MIIKKIKETKKTIALLEDAKKRLRKMYDEEKDFEMKYQVLQPALATIIALQFDLVGNTSIFFLNFLK